jgi:Zn-dependent M28 family amino/carboxypeptidase
VSAHLDHLARAEPINGDRIYNGAMDNASGVAAILEVANAIRESSVKPARSILFVAVTGEENGLIGSRYFAARANRAAHEHRGQRQHRHVPAAVSAEDADGPRPRRIRPGDDIKAAAAQAGVGVQPDPEPQRNRFVRSDQYSFIKLGIPALAMKVGYEPNSPEAAIAAKWTAERYHAPSDDLNQPIDMSAAGAYVAVVRDLAVRIANRETRPKWNNDELLQALRAGYQHPLLTRSRLLRRDRQVVAVAPFFPAAKVVAQLVVANQVQREEIDRGAHTRPGSRR